MSPLSTVSLQHGVFLPVLLPFQQPLEPFCAVTDHPKPLWAHQNKFSVFSEVCLHIYLLLFSKVTLSLTVPSASLLLRQQVALYMHNPTQSLANLPQWRMLKCCQGRTTPLRSHPIFSTWSSQDSTLPSSSWDLFLLSKPFKEMQPSLADAKSAYSR